MFRTLSSNSFLLFYHFDTFRQMLCFHFSIRITAVKCREMLRAGFGTARASVFCSAQGLGLLARRYFAPRRVSDCFRAGILLRAGWGTAFAWVFCSASSVTPTEFILLRLFIRGCATAYPCLRSFAPSGLVYQGLRYRLPLSKVFRPVGAIR